MIGARIILIAALGAPVALGGPAISTLAQEPPPEVQDKPQEAQPEAPPEEGRVDTIDQRLRILERQREMDQEQAVDRAAKTPFAGAGPEGFFLQSADGAFLIRIRGIAQFDGRDYQEDQDRPATDTFLLRTLRPLIEGTVYGKFYFRLMPDFGQGKTVLQDGYMDLRFTRGFQLRAGKFKAPFGLERLQSEVDTLFIERALPTNLVPNRDLGVQWQGEVAKGLFAYALGVFNGVVDGGIGDGDTTDSKDLAARVFVQPFKNMAVVGLQGFGIGVAATYGHERGTTTATGLPSYLTTGQQTFFTYRSDGTVAGTILAFGTRRRLSPQAYYYGGRVGVLAEYVESSQVVALDSTLETLDSRAKELTASVFLTDDAATYKTVVPRRPYGLRAKGWGALQLVARYSELTVDRSAFPRFADPAKSARQAKAWGTGLNWYVNRNVRINLDYDQTRFEGGDTAGADRPNEKLLTSRFQIGF